MSNQVPEGWQETTLEYVTEYINRGIAPSYSNEGVLVINQRCIRNGKVSFGNARFTDKKKISVDKKLQSFDILVCSTGVGTLGRVGQLKGITGEITVDSHVSIVRSSQVVNSLFLGYCLKSNEKQIEHLAEGSTGQTELPRKKLANLEVLLPSMQEQRSIVAILSMLDNKIELLQKQNKTLEQIAQTIFKEWFVNFNFPNKNGKPYKASGGKMIESEMGLIPDGWEVGILGDYVNHVKQNVIPDRLPNNVFEHYSLPAFDQGKIPVAEKGEEIKSNKYKVTPYSFLVSKLNPRIPRIWIIFSANKNAICSTEFQVLAPKQIKSFGLIHCFLNTPNFSDQLSAKASGTSSSHQRVRPGDILNIQVANPEMELIESFNDMILPNLNKININMKQIQNLKKLRDILLPKLMSGKIRFIMKRED